MILEHYSREPFNLSSDYWYRNWEQGAYTKPPGFWISVKGDDDWPSWCQREEYCIERLKYVNTIDLGEKTNLLRLSNSEEAMDFTEEFALFTDVPNTLFGNSIAIDWFRVRDQYDGIIIPNYLWSVRLKLLWYYGWDCASGCVWNLGDVRITNCELSGIEEPIIV